LDDELVRRLLLVAGLFALRMAPWAEKVLTTTTRLGTTFTTTVRMVDRVHAHTANGRAGALPAGAARLAADDVHVLNIADLADRGVADSEDLADFTGRHAHQGVFTFTVGENRGLTGGTGDNTTTPGTSSMLWIEVPRGILLRGSALPNIRSGFFTGHHGSTDVSAFGARM
jgi:hypothetical protein